MKRLAFLSIFLTAMAQAQFDSLPDSPLDTSMGEAAGDTTGTLNQVHPTEFEKKQEQERQEELLENRYDVPDEKEEEEFNKNAN